MYDIKTYLLLYIERLKFNNVYTHIYTIIKTDEELINYLINYRTLKTQKPLATHNSPFLSTIITLKSRICGDKSIV